jgi:hypothetical protein
MLAMVVLHHATLTKTLRAPRWSTDGVAGRTGQRLLLAAVHEISICPLKKKILCIPFYVILSPLYKKKV